MTSWDKAGFTIIETMLFLGITALLIMGVLMGTSNSINIQRYRDSVSSLQSMLQQQYSEVSNVSNNDSTRGLTCNGIAVLRGQSDCVILGRFITTADSRKITIQSVVGLIPSGSTALLNDVDVFLENGYNIKISSAASETYDIEWGASLTDPAINNSNPMVFSMLVLRSPLSGVTRTFISNSNVVDIQDLVNVASTQKVGMCVDSSGLLSGGAKSAIVVMPNATGPNSVETLGDNSGC
jgi:Tfp pilus assembly protein FimT